jgi:hypothetical protein
MALHRRGPPLAWVSPSFFRSLLLGFFRGELGGDWGGGLRRRPLQREVETIVEREGRFGQAGDAAAADHVGVVGAEQVQRAEALVEIVQYLDAMRARI